jgi:hypothetical protein
MNVTDVIMTEAKIAFGIHAREGMRNPKANKTKTPVNVGCNIIHRSQFLTRSGMYTNRRKYWLAESWPRLRLALNSFQMKR